MTRSTERVDEVAARAQDLLSRLNGWSADHLTDENYREWGGHVEPAMESLSAAIAAMQPAPLKPLDKADDPALNWIIKNCTAIRRDNGAMEYNLTQMVRAFQAGAETVNKENTDE